MPGNKLRAQPCEAEGGVEDEPEEILDDPEQHEASHGSGCKTGGKPANGNQGKEEH